MTESHSFCGNNNGTWKCNVYFEFANNISAKSVPYFCYLLFWNSFVNENDKFISEKKNKIIENWIGCRSNNISNKNVLMMIVNGQPVCLQLVTSSSNDVYPMVMRLCIGHQGFVQIVFIVLIHISKVTCRSEPNTVGWTPNAQNDLLCALWAWISIITLETN